MIDAVERAKKVFDDLCAAIEARNWKYTKEEDKLLVHFGVVGEDLPMHFVIIVDIKRQYIRLLSPIPFDFSEEKRVEGAIAACAMNMPLAEGCFDFDLKTGRIWFRQAVSFHESTVGDALFQHMISYACSVVDLFNDRLQLLVTDKMSLAEFLESFE